MQNFWRSCSVRKNGSCSVHLHTQGFIKILMTDVERARARRAKLLAVAEVERAEGATEAGAFGQRGKRGRL